MNFKLILLIFILIGCGVKSDPLPPSDGLIPSIEEQYLKVPKSFKDEESKKKKKKS